MTDEARTRHVQMTQNLTADDIKNILKYTVNKLLKGHQPGISTNNNANPATICSMNNESVVDDDNISDDSAATQTQTQTTAIKRQFSLPLNSVPAIYLKCFYQVNSLKSVNLLTQSIEEYQNETESLAKIAATVIPVCQLSTITTFFTICGIRHE